MDIKLLSYFKNKLVAGKNALVGQINRLRRPVDMGDDVDSFEEEADEATETAANAGMVETLKRRVHRIEDALLKMEKGKYGICERCGNAIEKQLLEIDPESRYCRSCKMQMQK